MNSPELPNAQDSSSSQASTAVPIRSTGPMTKSWSSVAAGKPKDRVAMPLIPSSDFKTLIKKSEMSTPFSLDQSLGKAPLKPRESRTLTFQAKKPAPKTWASLFHKDSASAKQTKTLPSLQSADRNLPAARAGNPGLMNKTLFGIEDSQQSKSNAYNELPTQTSKGSLNTLKGDKYNSTVKHATQDRSQAWHHTSTGSHINQVTSGTPSVPSVQHGQAKDTEQPKKMKRWNQVVKGNVPGTTVFKMKQDSVKGPASSPQIPAPVLAAKVKAQNSKAASEPAHSPVSSQRTFSVGAGPLSSPGYSGLPRSSPSVPDSQVAMSDLDIADHSAPPPSPVDRGLSSSTPVIDTVRYRVPPASPIRHRSSTLVSALGPINYAGPPNTPVQDDNAPPASDLDIMQHSVPPNSPNIDMIAVDDSSSNTSVIQAAHQSTSENEVQPSPSDLDMGDKPPNDLSNSDTKGQDSNSKLPDDCVVVSLHNADTASVVSDDSTDDSTATFLTSCMAQDEVASANSKPTDSAEQMFESNPDMQSGQGADPGAASETQVGPKARLWSSLFGSTGTRRVVSPEGSATGQYGGTHTTETDTENMNEDPTEGNGWPSLGAVAERVRGFSNVWNKRNAPS
ncbi:hypothetical protein F5Y16DRAFT_380650 [Xylariaceae sp. FL0255]|nr:hypothetical protein F5Y16DRAFT_380650 [Xylariaceae sp. FL0255]